MPIKTWNAGDVVNASDLNGNFALTGRFGGTGSDGPLSISSGTTTIDLAGQALVVKNYTSISITGTGALAFINPHANGSLIVLRSQGNVTITSSATRAIDLRNLGATGGSTVSGTTNQNGNDGNPGKCGMFLCDSGKKGVGSTAGNGGSTATFQGIPADSQYIWKYPFIWVGAGGGSGGVIGNGSGSSATSGKGGRAAGSMIIECGGALNFTGTIDASGEAGGNASAPSSPPNSGGGGGGSGGDVLIPYNSLTANSGTINVSAGAGGSGAGNWGSCGAGGGGANGNSAGNPGNNSIPDTGGAGATGTSLVFQNTTIS